MVLIFLFVLSFGSIAHAELDEATRPIDNCRHDETTFRCVTFIENYDADTIKVSIPNVHPLLGNKISVRVLGVDAAEMRGKTPCEKDRAEQAQQVVSKVLGQAKNITLKNVQRDKYFRILADVDADGKSIREVLKQENLVVDYSGGHKGKVDWCSKGKKPKPTKTDEP